MATLSQPLSQLLDPDENYEALAEYRANLIEDNVRVGFMNLGSGSNTVYSIKLPVDENAPKYISAQGGHDLVVMEFWSFSNDVIYGGSGMDTIMGGGGLDTLYGGSGNDFLYGDWSNDILYGGSGRDTLDGGNQGDLLYGGSGNDLLIGNRGSDTMFGGSGDDVLWGGELDGANAIYDGEDVMYGGAGNDTLIQSADLDTMWGGDGADIFVFKTLPDGIIPQTPDERGSPHDYIADFNRAEGDLIDLSAIDANPWQEGNQAFFIPEYTYEITTGTIRLNGTDANGDCDVIFRMNSTHFDSAILTVHVGIGNSLSPSDFIL